MTARLALLCVSILSVSTLLAQTSKSNSNRDARKPVLKGREQIEIVGTVVARDRDSGIAVGFEGGYRDVLILRIEKVLKGKILGHYVRADFSGWATYDTDPRMPTSFLNGGNPRRITLHPPDSHGEECAYTVPTPAQPGDLSGDFNFNPILVPVGATKSFPDANSLYCYTFTLPDLQ